MILLKNKSSVVTTFIGLFFLFSLLLMTGCEKENEVDIIHNEESVSIIDESNGIDLEHSHDYVSVEYDENYGYYLHIISQEKGDALMYYLEQMNEESIVLWESELNPNFISLREHQVKYETDNPYPDPAMATLLNHSGYIMIDGILYFDDYISDKQYIIYENGRKELYNTGNDVSVSRSSCYRADDTDDPCHEATRCGNGKCSLWLIAQIDHVKPVLGNEKLYLRSRMKISPCGGSGESTVTANHHIYVTYSIVVDGIGQSGTSVYYGPSYTNQFNVLLASGDDVCINYVDSEHQSSCPYGYVEATPNV